MPATQGPPPGYAGPGQPAHGQGGYPPAYGGRSHGGPPPHRAPSPGTPSTYGPPPQQYGPPPQYAPPQYAPATTGHAPPAARRRRLEPMPTGGPVTDEDERWAVPAYVGMFVGGFVAPAVVYVVKGRTSPFARFHAVQALNLFIAMTVCDVAVYGLMYLIGLAGLLIALGVVAAECFCVIKAAIGANRCEWYRLPPALAWPILR